MAPTCYYDVENRLSSATSWDSGYRAYSYAPGNKRVWRGVRGPADTQTLDEFTFWSVDRAEAGDLRLSASTGTAAGRHRRPGPNHYFGGKLIKNATGYVTPDRLGSIGKYFPYGQERPSATTTARKSSLPTSGIRRRVSIMPTAVSPAGHGQVHDAGPIRRAAGRAIREAGIATLTRGDPVQLRTDTSGLQDSGCPPGVDLCFNIHRRLNQRVNFRALTIRLAAEIRSA